MLHWPRAETATVGVSEIRGIEAAVTMFDLYRRGRLSWSVGDGRSNSSVMTEADHFRSLFLES